MFCLLVSYLPPSARPQPFGGGWRLVSLAHKCSTHTPDQWGRRKLRDGGLFKKSNYLQIIPVSLILVACLSDATHSASSL